MRNLTLLIAFLLSGNSFCNPIDTVKVASKISDVTVFFTGAQITRHSDLKITKGKHVILIGNLPQEVNPQSIQVNGIAGCQTLSVKHQMEYGSNRNKGKEELDLENDVKLKQKKIKEIKNRINVYEIEEKIILDNSKFGKTNEGSSITEIKEGADFYRQRLNEIRIARLNLLTELETADDEITKTYSQINKLLSERSKVISQILVSVNCEKEIATGLTFSYYIPSAGWAPLYDFRVVDANSPLSIVYNANVYQSSGENWNNVKIKLSTTNPSLSGEVPELSTWYLGRRAYSPVSTVSRGAATLKGSVLDRKTLEPIPFVTILVENNNNQIAGTTSDFDGHYSIKPLPPGRYDVKASFVGYKPILIQGVTVRADNITYTDIEMEQTMVNIETIEVVDYKVPLIEKDKRAAGTIVTSEGIAKMPSRSGNAVATAVGGVYSDDRQSSMSKRESGSLATTDYLSNILKSTLTNLEYEIDLPYTILSDGEDYAIKIKDVNLPVNYVYHAIPKLEQEAFLIAEIPEWEELNLLSGKSSIYYQGTFIGESAIDADQTADTLSISLGRDQNIILSREGNKDIFDKKVLGNNVKEVIGWDITVKNNRSSKSRIIVEDQFPISEKRSVVVEQLSAEDAKVDSKTGKITWDFELNPNEKKVLTFSYSVKYPKYESLMLE